MSGRGEALSVPTLDSAFVPALWFHASSFAVIFLLSVSTGMGTPAFCFLSLLHGGHYQASQRGLSGPPGVLARSLPHVGPRFQGVSSTSQSGTRIKIGEVLTVRKLPEELGEMQN